MTKHKFEEPQVSRREMAEVLVKGLGRKLTDQEIETIYWLGDSEREVILDFFKELVKKQEDE